MRVRAEWYTALIGVAASALSALPATASEAAKPSFDCAKATLRVERIICSDAGLSAADRRVAAIYAEARQQKGAGRDVLLKEQRDFLHEREQCKSDDDQDWIPCLARLYELRGRELFANMPLITQLRRPVSTTTADRLLPVFRMMTPEDLSEAADRDNREALSQASCRYFSRFPEEAARLMDAAFYSTQDSWTPLCRELDITEQIPATAGLLHVLETIEGAQQIPDCTGTAQYGTVRTQMVARVLAVVQAHPDYAAQERSHQQRLATEASFGYHPGLRHWSEQGLWERRRYAELEREMARARPAIAAEYQRRFALDSAAADRLADYHVGRIVDTYTGSTGATSTLFYPSLCLSLTDLDRYLQTGTLPTQACPDGELFEPGSGATLRRLLGLAIINDYPLAVIRRLMAAGAILNPAPASLTYEFRESLLMMAAARADVTDALLQAGADATLPNRFGKTALMYAIQERNEAAVRSLLRAGADVNATTRGTRADDGGMRFGCSLEASKRTALMYAAWHGTPAIARLLLAAHAKAESKDSDGKTAAGYIAANRRLSPTDRRLLHTLLDVESNRGAVAAPSGLH